MDSDAIRTFLLHSSSVSDIFLPVNLGCFANLMTSVVSSYNLNFIIHSDGHRSGTILLSQIFGKRGRHHLSSNMRGCFEMHSVVFALVRIKILFVILIKISQRY